MSTILMFTPALQASAIGRMAVLIVRELQNQGHTVTVVRAESQSKLGGAAHNFGAPIVNWTDTAALEPLFRQADTVIYQIGDNYEYHQGCLEWIERQPGIVCLHDYFLGNLFWAWAQARRAEADAVLKVWYGEEMAASYFAHANSTSFINATCQSAPMTEWIAAMALGIVSHSNWGAPRLQRACPGPVQIVPLPYNAPALGSNAGMAPHDSRSFNILTVGHVNPNKRVDSVIQAIGVNANLRERSVYRVVGQIQTSTVVALSGLARNYQVNLVIYDSIDDAALANAFEQADVIVCLRWPSLEAASASAIEAMLYAKPTIVTDTHFYSEIPDDCVIKINPDNEIDALQLALEKLQDDPAFRRQLGLRAQTWAQQTFRADYYAGQLANMSEVINGIAPIRQSLDWCYQTLMKWGATTDLLACEEVRGPLRLFNTLTPPQADPASIA